MGKKSLEWRGPNKERPMNLIKSLGNVVGLVETFIEVKKAEVSSLQGTYNDTNK
jgi:hypothetical protein